MRRALVNFILLIAFSPFSFSKTFNLTDTSLISGYYCSYAVSFELNKTTFRPESFAHLDSVIVFLAKHPSSKMEIGVHTDSRACKQQEKMSTNLPQARARAIIDYFISKGIPPNRLIAKGYGCSKLLIRDEEISKLQTKEEQEAAHQKNRRVEYKILSI